MASKKKADGETALKATVIQEFRDINDFDKVFAVGDDVSDLDEARLTSLSEKGLVEIEKPEEKPTETDPPK